MRIASSLFLLACATAAHAQEVTVAGGVTRMIAPRDSTYAWLVSYAHDVAPHIYASYTYRNEGHFPSHHRDGHSVQLWATTNEGPGFSLRAGAGAYRFFDTTVAERGDGFSNAHGWAGLYSVEAAWRDPNTRWTWLLRADRIDAAQSFDTVQVTAGASYALDQDTSFHRPQSGRAAAARVDELTVMAGQTIVNSFESEGASARLVEYRHAFRPALRASVGFMNEGDARLIRRNGAVAQLWLEPSFGDDRLTFGVGFGPYVSIDHARAGRARTLGMVGTTFSYRLGRSWTTRISWNRVASNYDRDSDIITAGIGYRF